MSNEIKNEKPSGPATFAGLGLGEEALAAVRRIGFEEPTEIQEKFIPAADRARLHRKGPDRDREDRRLLPPDPSSFSQR